MTILLTNDDGWDAPGIAKLAEIALQFTKDVYVVAPAGQRSAISHGITVRDALRVERVAFPVPVKAAYSCSGTPADCVKLAIRELLPVKPDYVFSGINFGFNLAYDTVYSGTVSAAMEGMYYGVESYAISTDGDQYELVDRYLLDILKNCMGHKLESHAIWNINFPACGLAGYQGILHTKPGSFSQYLDFFEKIEVAEGVWDYKMSNVPCLYEEPDTDVDAVKTGYISIGTLQCDFLAGRHADAYEVTKSEPVVVD